MCGYTIGWEGRGGGESLSDESAKPKLFGFLPKLRALISTTGCFVTLETEKQKRILSKVGMELACTILK